MRGLGLEIEYANRGMNIYIISGSCDHVGRGCAMVVPSYRSRCNIREEHVYIKPPPSLGRALGEGMLYKPGLAVFPGAIRRSFFFFFAYSECVTMSSVGEWNG